MAVTLQTRKKKGRRDLVSLGELLVESATIVPTPAEDKLRTALAVKIALRPGDNSDVVAALGLTGLAL